MKKQVSLTMNYIVSWFYSEIDEIKSNYSQVNADSTSDKFQEVYWKCIVSFYNSSLKYNNDKKHIFYTNLKELPPMKNIDLKNFFLSNNIEVREIQLTNKTPEDWFTAWRNQFYVFDILKDLQELLSDEDNLLILDSDCIINQNLDGLFEDVQKMDAVVYDIGYPNDWVINTITQDQMNEMYFKFFGIYESIRYYGGEFIAINAKVIKHILEEFRSLWKKNYALYETNSPKLTEEAHFLSIIYHKLNLANSFGDKYIKRLWNSNKYNNIKNEDINLPVYHLPSQKTTGFKYYFQKAIVKGQDIERDDLVKIFNISNTSKIIRRVKEMGTKILFKVSK